MKKLTFSLFLIASVYLSMHGQIPRGLSPVVSDVLIKSTEFMNRSSYDSAQFIISKAFAQTDNPVSELDLYYLHCYESEIMYYNALFEQGLNSSYRALEIATKLKNDTLLGNSENFIGLFMLNLDRLEEASQHLHKAVELIPKNHHNEYLSFQYHALANLGESYLKRKMPDEALLYSRLSIDEAQNEGRTRGVAIAYWNIAEAFGLKSKPDSTIAIALRGLTLVSHSPHRDVVQTFCATLMEAYQQKHLPDSVYSWMNKGLAENSDALNTDFSRILFLQNATDLCVKMKDIDKGVILLDELNLLERSISSKQQAQRISIIKDYYEKNQKLVVAKELDLAQKQELGLRKTIAIILGALAALLIILIFSFRQSSRRKQRIAELQHNEELRSNAREMEIVSLRTRMEAVFSERNRIASDLHDDIGAALSSIRIYSGAAQKNLHTNVEETADLIARINEGSTGMMERMGDIVWSINPKNDTAQSLLLRMKTFASEVLSTLDIRIAYHVDNSITDLHPTMTARRNIYLIFKEAVNNIAKYSKASNVVVEMSIADNQFLLHIADDGVGFHTAQAQQGNGLVNMNNRAKALHGQLHITSHVGRGTKLQFKVDLKTISDQNYQGNEAPENNH
jgi:signal transduction histidine kinase